MHRPTRIHAYGTLTYWPFLRWLHDGYDDVSTRNAPGLCYCTDWCRRWCYWRWRKRRWRAQKYVEFRRYSIDELGRHKLGTRRPPSRRSADLVFIKSRPRNHLPAEFDARLHWPGWIHAPTDQGGCGASWAFSTASKICSLFKRLGLFTLFLFFHTHKSILIIIITIEHVYFARRQKW